MGLKIKLCKYNGEGSSAGLETTGDFGGDLSIAEGMTLSAKTACKKAAERLRKAADRFDALALEADPYKIKVQDRINRS